MPTWPLALLTLPVGFAVAEVTGSRPLGGLTLVALGLATVGLSDAPRGRRIAWGGVAFACFVVSHPLGAAIGSWPAVAVVSAVTGAAGLALLERGVAVQDAAAGQPHGRDVADAGLGGTGRRGA